jgi:hypothetical protein
MPAAAVADKQADAASAKPNETQFQQAFKEALKRVLPGGSPERLQILAKAYEEAKGNKAQAVSREEDTTWRTSDRETAYAAEQSALESCQIRYRSPCILVAVNDVLAELPSDGNFVGRSMSRVNYEGLFDPTKIALWLRVGVGATMSSIIFRSPGRRRRPFIPGAGFLRHSARPISGLQKPTLLKNARRTPTGLAGMGLACSMPLTIMSCFP